MQLVLKTCEVRSWREDDARPLALHADNPKIWRNLRDAFPHPYTIEDARTFITMARSMDPETLFAIAVDGEVAGAIGYHLKTNVERISAELGYWLAEPFWGRGVTTEAVRAVTGHAVRTHGLSRVYAVPYEYNAASCRVLEKAGYTLEARMRRSALKEGRIVDQFLYAFVVPG